MTEPDGARGGRLPEQAEFRPAVSCPACKRLFNVPPGAQLAAVIRCPFCTAQMRLAERTVLVAEAVEAA